MPKWLTFAFALFLSLQVFSTRGQDVDDVINRYMMAMGGRERLKTIQSVYMQGIAVTGDGKKAYYRTRKVKNRLLRREIVSGNASTLYITNSAGVTSRTHTLKDPLLPADMTDNQVSSLDCEGPLVDYAVKGHKATLDGKAEINGKECFKIKLRLQSGPQIIYYIDAASWLITRETHLPKRNEDMIRHISYADYTTTGQGYVFPLTVSGNDTYTRYSKIEVNAEPR